MPTHDDRSKHPARAPSPGGGAAGGRGPGPGFRRPGAGLPDRPSDSPETRALTPAPDNPWSLIPLLEHGGLSREEWEQLATEPPDRLLERLLEPRGAAFDADCIPLENLDPPAEPDTLDVLHYDIRVDEVDLVNRSFHAVTTITFRALKPLGAAGFDLARVQVLDVLAGRPGPPEPVAYALFDSVLVVQLPETIETDSIAVVTVEYESSAATCVNLAALTAGMVFDESGFYTMGEPIYARYWYPCHDVPWDKATVSLTLTVPPGLAGSGSGVLVDSTRVDGLDRLTWSVPFPVSAYLLALYARNYVCIRETSPDGIPLEYFVPTELEEAARISLRHTPDMIHFLSTIYPYPYPRYAMTVTSGGGGMEHVMNSLLEDLLIQQSTASADPFVVHELAHQWWGDLVTMASWRDIWLNEGFATYMEWLYDEHAHGWAARARHANPNFNESRLGVPILDPEPPFSIFAFGFSGNYVTYQKGARVLDMLRGISRLRLMQGLPRPPEAWKLAGLAGDDRFLRILTRYTGDHAFGTATSLDFQHAAEAELGEDLAWFFEPWLRGTGFADLAYDWRSTTTPTGVNLDVQIDQVQDFPTRYRGPLQVRYRSGDTLLDEVRELSEGRTEWVVSLPPGEWEVELDPDDWLMHRARQVGITPEPPGSPFPNPSAVGFSLVDTVPGQEPAQVTLTVLDVQGRRVWQEDLGQQPPGPLSLRWEGQDLSGRRARPGAYHARLRMGTRTVVRRLVVLSGSR